MKISILIDISVTWFYIYWDILINISRYFDPQNINEVKIIKTHENVNKRIKNDIKSKNDYIIIEIQRNWYITCIIYDNL